MHSAVAQIDLRALSHNLNVVHQKAPGKKVLAMIKANAYGHGIFEIAHALEQQVDYLGVAYLEEALLLRQMKITQPIVLMTGFSTSEELELLIEKKIQSVLHSPFQIELLKHFSGSQKISLWLKINTGMNRLGFQTEEALKAYFILKKMKCLESLIWMTHLSSAAEAFPSPETLSQVSQFRALTEAFPEPKSVSNSAAIFHYPEAQFDIVRPGRMLYGISSFPDKNGTQEGILPVMRLTANIMAIRSLLPGESLGYGRKFKAPFFMRVALVSIGYGDGYPERVPPATSVYLRGKLAPILGQISMDSLSIDISNIPDAQLFDEVILWGPELFIEDLAKITKHSASALLTGLSYRVKRKYVNNF